MFEKRSHVNTSVSWGGCAAVWAQTPRQAKETDSSFALSCRLAEQAGPHQNRRPLQIFIISPLLTSLLIFPWNKRSHKVLIIPLSFHTFKSLGRDQNLLISDIIRPKELVLDFPVQGSQKLCPSSPAFLGFSRPSDDRQLSSSASATQGKLQEHPLYLEHSAELWNTPSRRFSLHIIHLAPFPLGTKRITLELFFPDLFIECQSSFYWLFLRGSWRGWFYKQPPWICYLRVEKGFPSTTNREVHGSYQPAKLPASPEVATQLSHCIWGLLCHPAI